MSSNKPLLLICMLVAGLAGVAEARPLLGIQPIPAIERSVVFFHLGQEDRGRPVPAPVFYADYVAASYSDPVTVFDNAERAIYLTFFAPIVRRNSKLIAKSELMSSDDAEPVTNWPLRYVVRLNDSTPDRHAYGDPPQRELRPYAKPVQTDVRRFDREGQELDVLSGKPTGRRVYKLGERYYLGTVSVPRKLLSVFEWQLCTQSQHPRLIPCYRDESNPDGSVKFVRGSQADRHAQDAVNNIVSEGPQSARSISSLKEIWALHDDPVRPLVISDHPVSPQGRIIKGRGMCVADCAPGLQFKLLRKGQSALAPKP
jgi:hypothetical protein